MDSFFEEWRQKIPNPFSKLNESQREREKEKNEISKKKKKNIHPLMSAKNIVFTFELILCLQNKELNLKKKKKNL